MSRSVTLVSTGSNSGKTVIGNGLCYRLKKSGVNVGFFKALSIDKHTILSLEKTVVGAHLLEYAQNCGSTEVSKFNNPCHYNPTEEILYLHGEALGKYELMAEDNLDLTDMPESDYEKIKQAIVESITILKSQYDFLVIEGGGCCTDNLVNEFSNFLPAIVSGGNVVPILNGQNGGVAPQLLGLMALAPAEIRDQLSGFVCNFFDPAIKGNQIILSKITELTGMKFMGHIGNIEYKRTVEMSEEEAYLLWQNLLQADMDKNLRMDLSL